MGKLKKIIRWGIGIMLGLYLSIILLISLPFFQNWFGDKIADALSDKLGGTKVEVGRVQLGLTGRLIVDDIRLWDLQNKESVSISRTGAKISLLPLIKNGDIHINNAILFGAHIHLYQDKPESDINIKFIIDAFKGSDDNKPLPNISIGSMLVRHTSVSYDRNWLPETPDKFNKDHIKISELSLSADIDYLNSDSLSATIKKLSFNEKSGFELKHIEAQILKKKDVITIKDFVSHTANSNIKIPSCSFDIDKKKGKGNILAHVDPRDAKAFLPVLEKSKAVIDAQLTFETNSASVKVTDFLLNSMDNSVDIDMPYVEANNLKDSIPNFSVKVTHLIVKPVILEHIEPFVSSLPAQVENLIKKCGSTIIEGEFAKNNTNYIANTHITTDLGQLDIDGSYNNRHIVAKLNTDNFKLGNLISAIQEENDSIPFGDVAFTADTNLLLPQSFKKQASKNILSVLPSGKIKLDVKEANIKNYAYHNIKISVNRQKDNIDFLFNANDPAITLNFQGNATAATNNYAIQGLLDVAHLKLQELKLTKKGVHDIRTKVGIDLAGDKFENLSGDISIPHIILKDENGDYTLSKIQLQSMVDEDNRHLSLFSPYVTSKIDGQFDWSDLVAYLQQTVHHWIPSIVKAPKDSYDLCKADFSLNIVDPSPLERLTNVPLHLDEGPLTVAASIDSRKNDILIKANAPKIAYGEQEISNLSLFSQSQNNEMKTDISISRLIKGNYVDFSLQVNAQDELLTTQFNWDDHLEHITKGSLALRGNLIREDNQIAIDGEVLPTSFQVSDTLWNIQPAKLTYKEGVVNVKDFRVKMEDGNRWLSVDGKASKSATDTLHVNLQGIELGYIFEFMHVKPIHMGGLVTGSLYGIHLFDNAEAHGDITVPHLYLNKGDLGSCIGKLHWGVKPGNLDLEVYTKDEANNSWIKANGWLHLIKDPYQMLDLNFEIQRGNMYLINRYTQGIMEDVQARATGKLRVYGTFGDVCLDGEAIVEEAAMTIPSIGVRYHAVNQRLKVRPDGVVLDHITGYDPMGGPGIEGHQAIIDGRISYDHFRDMTYKFTINGDNVLVYNFPDFGDLPFCGVVNGTGKVDISGRPGLTNIEIDAHPTQDTQMIYKVASPKTLTQSKFITFVDHNVPIEDENDTEADDEEEKPEGDMYINFNLDITPEAELKLLMDPAAGDYISLFGDSRLRCSYYNKGNFRMYGTYRVDHGIYRMSIQSAIRKDFQFAKNSTIVFGGNPFDADLGLQAVYTVPSVSLNDLSARGTFSNNTVRVNCLMNLGGKAGAPRITFDFDIPNVNEDELRMVRSLISTEEERNLQVIYLLGIGRFYTYDYTGAQTQSSTALNSMLSSTISGQLNQMFNTIMGGNQNWNIGANLSTGDTGWSDMDVEGILSGRLLNNRLLINGNFGYRDNPVAASNFIGDFDLQWILNRNGNLILKGYSETNDRYFTKSALTTQGIGILLKKDFIRWSDLFKRKKQ